MKNPKQTLSETNKYLKDGGKLLQKSVTSSSIIEGVGLVEITIQLTKEEIEALDNTETYRIINECFPDNSKNALLMIIDQIANDEQVK